MPRLAPIALALAAAAALAACTAGGPRTGAGGGTGGDAGPGVQPGPTTASRPDPAAPAEVDARPARFLGLSKKQVAGELGRPALVRREGPAAVWQYRATACVLDLAFYPGDGPATVAHLEARDPVDARPSAAEPCLATLLLARAAGAAS